MKKTTDQLIAEYKSEFIRTNGKEIFCCCYTNGWFRVGNSDKVRRVKFEEMIATLQSRPTVSDRTEMVNGVPTVIKASQHVVRSYLAPHSDIVEERDTPHCCSPSNETYWSM